MNWQASANPGVWARIEGYLKPGMLTGDQRIIELWSQSIPGLLALLSGAGAARVQFRGLFSAGPMVGGEGCLQDLSH